MKFITEHAGEAPFSLFLGFRHCRVPPRDSITRLLPTLSIYYSVRETVLYTIRPKGEVIARPDYIGMTVLLGNLRGVCAAQLMCTIACMIHVLLFQPLLSESL